MKIVLFQTIRFSICTQFKCKYNLIVKNILFQAIQLGQAVLIQFSISTDFPYTLLNVKQFSLVKIQFQCQKQFHFK